MNMNAARAVDHNHAEQGKTQRYKNKHRGQYAQHTGEYGAFDAVIMLEKVAVIMTAANRYGDTHGQNQQRDVYYNPMMFHDNPNPILLFGTTKNNIPYYINN